MNPTLAQLRAINSIAPSILVSAGPGSGKSATTVARIKRLVASGVEPSTVVALSYTNAAANVLQERLGLRLGFTGTLHGFALRCLKEYGEGMGYGQRISIVGEEAAADLLASRAQSLGYKGDVKKLAKMKASFLGQSASTRMSTEERVVRAYYAELREAGMVDFETILTEFLRLVQAKYSHLKHGEAPVIPPDRFTHLFVDEVQDSALIDWQIYEALPIANKFFVGDQDQSIYGFRGGRPDLMLEYSRRPYVETHLLEDNFRSHAEICEAAQRLIEHNADRIAKKTVSTKGEGGFITVFFPAMNSGEEAAQVIGQIKDHIHPDSCHEIAILARTNAICAEFREQLKANGIPVAEEAKSDLPQDWSLAKALVELLVNPENDTLAAFYLTAKLRAAGVKDAAKRVHMNLRDARAIGRSLNAYMAKDLGFEKIQDVGDPWMILVKEDISTESRMRVASIARQFGPGSYDLLQLALAMGQEQGEQADAVEGVTITTLHGAKGREWDVVFLVGFEDEILPGTRKDEDVGEARRLVYVGLTRARKQVFISHSLSRRTSWGAMEAHKISRFVMEAGL